MAEKSTFIKIDRNILEWEWYQNNNVKSLFIHLLLKANVKTKKWQGQTIKRGSLITSVPNLAKETGLSISQIKTALKHLKLADILTDQTSANFRIISIKNYDKYQKVDRQISRPMTDQSPTDDRPMTTTKEYKEYKECKEREEEESFSVDTNVPKVIYGKIGKGVLVLSDSQFDELVEMMPLDVFNKYCEKLSDWIKKNNRTCKNHFDIIKSWYEEDYGGGNGNR